MPALLAQLAACLRFYSRLPLPAPDARAPRPFDAASLWAVPLAGALIGLGPALVLGAAQLLWPPIVAAALAIAALVVVTGALHEDGLADCADAQGALAPPRKLEIMRDSRIGTFGALALTLGLVLRILPVAALAAPAPGRAMLVIVAAAAVSRTAGLLPALRLPPARADGAGAALGRPGFAALAAALAIAVVVGLLPVFAGAGVGRCLAAAAAALAMAAATAAVAKRQLGGFTGDVLGAAQQLAEIAVYLTFAAA